MVSTKENPGAFDGLERAAPDEPVFTLRAHDVLAAELVLEWVARKRKLIQSTRMSAAKREIELIQCRDAEEIAFAMQEYRAGIVEVPAEEEKTPKRISTNQMSKRELAAKQRFDSIKEASQKLNNAVADINDAVPLLKPYGFVRHCGALMTLHDKLKARAADIRPKRSSYAHLAEPDLS